MSTWVVRQVEPNDEGSWRLLYRGYRSFYSLPEDEAKLDTVWQWLHDPEHESRGFVAANEEGVLGGLAHVRRFARPSTATTGLFLDDLFTNVDYRGQGIGRALLDHLHEHAASNGLSVVRWITAESNTQARALYDSRAKQTSWVTYDMT